MRKISYGNKQITGLNGNQISEDFIWENKRSIKWLAGVNFRCVRGDISDDRD